MAGCSSKAPTAKSQISSTKYQINLKPQYSTRGASACAARDQDIEEAFIKFLPSSKFAFGILNFGHCCLFGICYLCFGI
jgi:hypothetical protein